MSGDKNLGAIRVFIGVAWPYVNNEPLLGLYVGSLLPPDIFARFQRMNGREVLMVSGSDCHGTPITVTAKTFGITPGEVVAKFYEKSCGKF